MDVLKVRPDDATLLHETKESASMEHCYTLFEGVESVSKYANSSDYYFHAWLA